jgi:hypothetical protein
VEVSSTNFGQIYQRILLNSLSPKKDKTPQ